ncbi:HEAT repeat domain-containing protein [Muricauda sp. CAU 1633]|uniref:PVC-type heme-binding CxxCH protein n=1 Tax=Allomuricauda sp. CAU 1633 TaxID=2816036 RepID=UPI001A90A4B4|nr:PVC-type heme-binding CxxCH protein [Muricauda sp. CAU 1633]MBO0323679.1 HEAT repeat domain-containing protein [Muricauda sp. CAU 1633]
MKIVSSLSYSLLFLSFVFFGCKEKVDSLNLVIDEGEHIVLIGNNLGSRMMNFGHFETEMHLRNAEKQLYIRNMCDGGDTPGFRAHSGRFSPWAFPGAEKYQDELANFSNSQGHFETPDQWLTRLKADKILAFFGYNESFNGAEGLQAFKEELSDFVDHSLNQKYNGLTAPELILVSPIAFEDRSNDFDLPNGEVENQNLEMYTQAMKEVAEKSNVGFVDVFHPTKEWFASDEIYTIDGFQLNDKGYKKFSKLLVDMVFGEGQKTMEENRELVKQAVLEKNWFWHDDYKSPNGVHVFGRRYNPFGPENYPDEIKKKREMTAIRDTAIWSAAKGESYDLAVADARTHKLPKVETNFTNGDYGRGEAKYLYGEESLKTLKMADGYKIELFASEEDFPDLANPAQLSFDNKGRLWVAVMPTYPHYKPGDPKPNDKLLILEDTDGDHKADKQTIFAEGLHIPAGFELAPEGVYVSQGTNLKLLIDTDGDDHADKTEIVLSGFDDHDTHHVISAFCADPSGAILMGEGVFLHTNVETPYGPVRATNGGFYRYSPQQKKLQRVAQVSIPNPWGTAFDRWGQPFFLETSGPEVRWMLPGSIKNRYGQFNDRGPSLLRQEDMVRPTSGLEFISSRHFPDEVQGDLLLNNTIGFLGMRQHKITDTGSGYKLEKRQDLIEGSDKNFRPVDMEFAPDGSLYLVDWHNVLIGHMQHNARDPLRDHVHGRIYRVTYPDRPLVEPAVIDGAPVETLLNNLKLPEYRTRYRTRRELRGRNADEVTKAIENWVSNLDESDEGYEHHLLEALWVSWGANKINSDVLNRLLGATDYRVRAAAVHVLGYAGHQINDQKELLLKMAEDGNSRVRMETLVAASWMPKEDALEILKKVGDQPMDEWLNVPYERAIAHVKGENLAPKTEEVFTHLEGADREVYLKGKEIYEREGFCITCHQKNGEGLAATGYPPLRQSKWVVESEERLIKITLNGIMGPMEVQNLQYDGQVPMTPFGGMLNDEEVAAVLTYIRNSFSNRTSVISPEKVKTVREEIKDKQGFYTAEELLKAHPHKKVEGKALVN